MSGRQNRLDIRVGIEIDLISVICQLLRWQQQRAIQLRGVEITLVLALESNLTSLCGGQNQIRFCVWAKNYLVLIYGSRVTWFLA